MKFKIHPPWERKKGMGFCRLCEAQRIFDPHENNQRKNFAQ